MKNTLQTTQPYAKYRDIYYKQLGLGCLDAIHAFKKPRFFNNLFNDFVVKALYKNGFLEDVENLYKTYPMDRLLLQDYQDMTTYIKERQQWIQNYLEGSSGKYSSELLIKYAKEIYDKETDDYIIDIIDNIDYDHLIDEKIEDSLTINDTSDSHYGHIDYLLPSKKTRTLLKITDNYYKFTDLLESRVDFIDHELVLVGSSFNYDDLIVNIDNNLPIENRELDMTKNYGNTNLSTYKFVNLANSKTEYDFTEWIEKLNNVIDTEEFYTEDTQTLFDGIVFTQYVIDLDNSYIKCIDNITQNNAIIEYAKDIDGNATYYKITYPDSDNVNKLILTYDNSTIDTYSSKYGDLGDKGYRGFQGNTITSLVSNYDTNEYTLTFVEQDYQNDNTINHTITLPIKQLDKVSFIKTVENQDNTVIFTDNLGNTYNKSITKGEIGDKGYSKFIAYSYRIEYDNHNLVALYDNYDNYITMLNIPTYFNPIRFNHLGEVIRFNRRKNGLNYELTYNSEMIFKFINQDDIHFYYNNFGNFIQEIDTTKVSKVLKLSNDDYYGTIPLTNTKYAASFTKQNIFTTSDSTSITFDTTFTNDNTILGLKDISLDDDILTLSLITNTNTYDHLHTKTKQIDFIDRIDGLFIKNLISTNKETIITLSDDTSYKINVNTITKPVTVYSEFDYNFTLDNFSGVAEKVYFNDNTTPLIFLYENVTFEKGENGSYITSVTKEDYTYTIYYGENSNIEFTLYTENLNMTLIPLSINKINDYEFNVIFNTTPFTINLHKGNNCLPFSYSIDKTETTYNKINICGEEIIQQKHSSGLDLINANLTTDDNLTYYLNIVMTNNNTTIPIKSNNSITLVEPYNNTLLISNKTANGTKNISLDMSKLKDLETVIEENDIDNVENNIVYQDISNETNLAITDSMFVYYGDITNLTFTNNTNFNLRIVISKNDDNIQLPLEFLYMNIGDEKELNFNEPTNVTIMTLNY